MYFSYICFLFSIMKDKFSNWENKIAKFISELPPEKPNLVQLYLFTLPF